MSSSLRPDRARYSLQVHDAIGGVARAEWNALLDEAASPFVEWDWLEALERSGCVGAGTGWRPRHLTLRREGRLVAAAPAYACDGSDGDFSRDWGWAEGAMRAGLRYYPKLQPTVPFTPATGRRLLVAAGEERAACVGALIAGAADLARKERYSSVHVLFTVDEDLPALEAEGLVRRVSFQYHWKNAGYATPDDFLARFDSKKRNQLKRERSMPGKQGISIRTVRGEEIAAAPLAWAAEAHTLHRSTIDKLAWGRGWLNLRFYEEVMTRMPHAMELVVAEREGRLVAGAFNVASATHLYGRYWGCHEEHPFLHFNVCLYHSVDECIRRGLLFFEGGAGGEHKLSRGFEPSETFSAHLFLDARLDEAVRHHLERENRALQGSLARWRDNAPVLKKLPDQPMMR